MKILWTTLCLLVPGLLGAATITGSISAQYFGATTCSHSQTASDTVSISIYAACGPAGSPDAVYSGETLGWGGGEILSHCDPYYQQLPDGSTPLCQGSMSISGVFDFQDEALGVVSMPLFWDTDEEGASTFLNLETYVSFLGPGISDEHWVDASGMHQLVATVDTSQPFYLYFLASWTDSQDSGYQLYFANGLADPPLEDLFPTPEPGSLGLVLVAGLAFLLRKWLWRYSR